ncbi:NADPH:quinone oxidoreductase [Ktedonobacter sp. SOSP1-52]|uniref:NADPH:quinone oxidoreductase family protein n=1 Tax=Ktedonobacter sp. SOSP1-52 TaxID=2778366 RepID=UPI001914FD0E|nr:NADPH:quinone oxidoreductase family protein [Ktedonobacter sp. SOSP1-52]GHO64058.1 NADPH:quinone oxidoreductase [Ktedonobacter sp. SOSP1-52]
MRALICKAYGDPSQLVYTEVPSPTLQAEEVRIAVHAIGLNYADGIQVSGRSQLPLPFSPGFECSGTVIECGSEVQALQPGDRVLAIMTSGAYAEEVVVPAAHVALLPSNMDMPAAAAFPVAYVTAHLALVHRGQLKPGEVLVVSGATGSVGSAALEIATRWGATVVAVTGRPEHLPAKLAAVFNPRQDDLAKRLLEQTSGRGVDLVFDTIGGGFFDPAWAALAWEGRYLTVGFASGQIPQLGLRQALGKNGAVIGFELGGYLTRRHALVPEALRTLLSWYEGGVLTPRALQAAPLSDGGGMLQRLVNHQIQEKIVLIARE